MRFCVLRNFNDAKQQVTSDQIIFFQILSFLKCCLTSLQFLIRNKSMFLSSALYKISDWYFFFPKDNARCPQTSSVDTSNTQIPLVAPSTWRALEKNVLTHTEHCLRRFFKKHFSLDRKCPHCVFVAQEPVHTSEAWREDRSSLSVFGAAETCWPSVRLRGPLPPRTLLKDKEVESYYF